MSEEINKAYELPKAYDPSAIEDRWAEYWTRERLFDVPTPDDTQPATKKFTMLLPPPNVTGRLHMGHMLNQTEMDILTRWHRMSGDTTLWVPGTDHAGIATQMMVERQLASEGTSRAELGREAFTKRVWCWKKEYGGAITTQMRRLGASVDWSREYFTMDDDLSIAVREAFVRLYEQGLIYRGAYIVNWDPAIQTAVSDLEVETEERIGKLYSIRYPLTDGSGHITIATTRPETMLGDVAVVVNPADERYAALVGRMVTLPLSRIGEQPNRQIPILADEWAKPEFGTGAVKVTPAHDPNDFAIGQRHNLPQPTIFDKSAHVDLPGSPYHGLDRFAARERILADLDALGLLAETKDHPMSVPVSQRSGVIIEPRLSLQWFLAVNKEPKKPGAPSLPTDSSSVRVGLREDEPAPNSIAAKAIAAVREGHIKFTPEMYAKTYFEWMTNLHDWCISRQLWWGHRIPAWHCDHNHITVARETPTVCSTCASTNLTQETDVLDTWFSSGLLPFTVFGWPGEQGTGNSLEVAANDSANSRTSPSVPCSLFPVPSPALAAFYPTQLLVTGFDILFFWVARMIMLGTHFMLDVPTADGQPRTLAEAVPFKEVYIHALVRDANREKMSKTKGNVIDPIEIITKYGTDAVRFTLASQASPGTDIAFNEARTEGYRAFANKIWNAARFLFMNIERAREAGITIGLEDLSSFRNGSAAGAAGGPASRTTTEPGAPSLPASSVRVGSSPASLESLWINARLAQTTASVQASLENYRFDEAASAIYQFFWGDFCDWYLEIVKLRLNFAPEDDLTQTKAALITLLSTFESALRLLSPFMPFITEEIWQAFWPQLGLETPAKSIALTRYPVPSDFPEDGAQSIAAMQLLQDLIVAIRGLRKENSIPEAAFAPIEIDPTPEMFSIIGGNKELLRRLARVSDHHIYQGDGMWDGPIRTNSSFTVRVLYERTIDIPAERERLTRDLAKYEKGLQAADRQLSNDSFMAKAPAHIVEGLRKQSTETRAQYVKTKAALESLPSE